MAKKTKSAATSKPTKTAAPETALAVTAPAVPVAPTVVVFATPSQKSESRDRTTIVSLIAALSSPDAEAARDAAAATLGKLADPRAVDALIHATRDLMAEASEEAVKALGLLHDPRAVPA